MASFFGEVTALSSRAVDEEELENFLVYDIKINKEDSSEVNCKLLIFSVGDLATAFAKCYLIPDNSQPLFDVAYSRNSMDTDSLMYSGGLKVNAKGSKAATAYRVSQDIITCEISSHVPEEINTNLCEMILKEINCLEIVVLTSCHMATYKIENSLLTEKPFLKSLSTSQFRAVHTTGIPSLEAPNFLLNFPAAVLTECEIKKKPAVCFVNYVDTNAFESLNVQNFESVLNENLNVKLVSVNDSQAKLVKFVNAAYMAESNLYT